MAIPVSEISFAGKEGERAGVPYRALASMTPSAEFPMSLYQLPGL
jgi:hypothetical protein